MNPLTARLTVLALALLAAMPFLGSVHLFDWDEINFAQASREMLERGDFLQVTIAGEPFYEKPPLYFWLQSLSISIFGDNEAAARLPSAAATVLTALLLFGTGLRLKDAFFGLAWAAFYLGSLLPLVTGRMGIIDPVFNLFIAAGLLALFNMDRDRRPSRLLALGAGIAMGLAVLAKGPLGLGIPLAIFFIYRLMGRDGRILWSLWLLVLAGVVLSAATWFLLETWAHGFDFVWEFLVYQVRLLRTGDAGHSGFPGYELVIFLFGCFPLSAFAIRGFFRRAEGPRSQRFQRLARVWLVFIIVLFALVRTKIPHYTSLTYMPAAFLAAIELDALRLRPRPSRTSRWLWGITGTVVALPLLLLPWLMRHRDLWLDKVDDPFAQANLSLPIAWPWWTFLPGALLATSLVLAAILTRRGRWLTAIRMQLTAVGLMVVLAWPTLLPKIEAHSQGGAIALYESLEDQPVDLSIAGFKSYAHLYYLGRKAWTAMDDPGQARLATPGDRPLYIVAPLHRLDEVGERYPSREIRREGGFVLLERVW